MKRVVALLIVLFLTHLATAQAETVGSIQAQMDQLEQSHHQTMESLKNQLKNGDIHRKEFKRLVKNENHSYKSQLVKLKKAQKTAKLIHQEEIHDAVVQKKKAHHKAVVAKKKAHHEAVVVHKKSHHDAVVAKKKMLHQAHVEHQQAKHQAHVVHKKAVKVAHHKAVAKKAHG